MARILLNAAIVLSLHSVSESFASPNATSTSYIQLLIKNGEAVYAPESLVSKLETEADTWHWLPWLKTRVWFDGNLLKELECIPGNSIDSFPDTIFTDVQLRAGGFLLFVLFGVYSFTLLAFVCNDYFVPSVECICENMKIPQNVAAATFMSVATSCPEFFVNVISTFLTESDMGIGTIVGSALFNCLGVAAIGGLAAIKPIPIEAGPVTRDVLIYMINVSVLVVIVWDGEVAWYEAMILGILYICYFIFMFNSMRLFRLLDKLVLKCRKKNKFTITDIVSEDRTNIDKDDKPEIRNGNLKTEENTVNDESESIVNQNSLWVYPKEKPWSSQLLWLYTWPLRLVLKVTVPCPVSYPTFYPLTFIMCIVWIGVNSYFVSWSMTVIGHTFLIPDSIMGMTFLAFGGCIPEACSIFIMSRRGEGGIGVSNALGANSLAILFALGMPWLIRTVTMVASGADTTVVYINSAGIDFIVASLLVAVASLWIVLFVGKYTLRKTVGAALICLYVIFVTFAILVETGIILNRGLTLC